MEKKIIGVTAYHSIVHRKTQDLLLTLKSRGYENVGIIWQEYKPRTQLPLYNHRPSSIVDIGTRRLAEILFYTTGNCPEDCDVILIGGANILDEEYYSKIPTINSHPGILPYTRGLDALKWAIFDEKPIGITTHIIDGEPDAGIFIEQKMIGPDYFETFFEFAMRLYQLEIEMLVDSLSLYKQSKNKIRTETYPVKKRMPARLELLMMEKYEVRKGLKY